MAKSKDPVMPAARKSPAASSTDSDVVRLAAPDPQVCQPRGPYCPFLNAALDAKAKGGLSAGVLMKLGDGEAEGREVIVHRGVINGQKRQLLLQCCPFCRGELEPRRMKDSVAHRSARQTLLSVLLQRGDTSRAAGPPVAHSADPSSPIALGCCDLHRNFPDNPGSCLNRAPGEEVRGVDLGEPPNRRLSPQEPAARLAAAQRASIAPLPVAHDADPPTGSQS